VVIRNAPTEMGRVASTLAFTGDGAELTVRTDFHRPPRYFVFRIPCSVELDSFSSDAGRAFEKGGLLFFTPDVTKASIKWRQKPGAHENNYQDVLKSYRSEFNFIVKDGNYDPARAGKPFLLPDEKDHPAEPLSFNLIRRAFLKEYGRRYAQHAEEGGKPYPVEPPELYDAAMRRAEFVRRYGDPKTAGIAVGKPVTASASLPNHPPAQAVDGIAGSPYSSWQTDPYPAWLKIDLEKPVKIGRVQVFPYWGGGRYYRYTVEVSTDGKEWRQVADRSNNSTPASPKGDDHRFEAVMARYIRVYMIYHNLNRGVHLVEVRVFGTE